MPVCSRQPLDSHVQKPSLAPRASSSQAWRAHLENTRPDLAIPAYSTTQVLRRLVEGTKGNEKRPHAHALPDLIAAPAACCPRQAPSSSLSTPPTRLSLGLAMHTPSARLPLPRRLELGQVLHRPWSQVPAARGLFWKRGCWWAPGGHILVWVCQSTGWDEGRAPSAWVWGLLWENSLFSVQKLPNSGVAWPRSCSEPFDRTLLSSGQS